MVGCTRPAAGITVRRGMKRVALGVVGGAWSVVRKALCVGRGVGKSTAGRQRWSTGTSKSTKMDNDIEIATGDSRVRPVCALTGADPDP